MGLACVEYSINFALETFWVEALTLRDYPIALRDYLLTLSLFPLYFHPLPFLSFSPSFSVSGWSHNDK